MSEHPSFSKTCCKRHIANHTPCFSTHVMARAAIADAGHPYG
jgi:hypothetical protein